MIDSLGSLGFSLVLFFILRMYHRNISLIANLQVVTYSACHLEKNNCFIIGIKDESEENVYYLGKKRHRV